MKMLKYISYRIFRGGLIVIKKGIILLLTLLMLALGVTQVVAQPMVFGPQEIIDKSELIIVGTVTKNLTSSNERTVTFKVDGVLKGNYNKKELTLKKEKPADGKWLDFSFPKAGQQVFLPLIITSATDYEFYSDLFNVGLIKNGKVQLFNPNNISDENKKDYELVYNDFVQSNFKAAGIKTEEPATKEDAVVVNAEEQASAESSVVASEKTNTDNTQVQSTEEKKADNQVFKAEKIVKNKELTNSNHKPRVRESLTIAIWLVIIFYSLSLVSIGRKDV